MKDISLGFKIIVDFVRGKKLIAIVFKTAALLFGVSFLSMLGGFVSFFSEVNSVDDSPCRHVVSFRNEQSASGADAYFGNRFFKNKRYTELNSAVSAPDKVGFPRSHVKNKVKFLSGVQKQCVAIARALVNDPDLILADGRVA